METGIINTSESSNKTQSRLPLQEQSLQKGDSWENLVRSIPNRSAINIKCAPYMPIEGKENQVGSSPPMLAYKKTPPMLAFKKLRAETSKTIRNWILALDEPVEAIQNDISTSHRTAKTRGHIRQYLRDRLRGRKLDDDYCLNLLDWGRSNILSIALGNTVYMWDASDGSTSVLVTVDQEKGPVTSVKLAPDGRHIAVGLNNSEVQLWDSTANRLLRTLRGGHISRVGSMDWNNHILTTGGMDGQIFNNDVRVRPHIVEAYRGHQQEVCVLKWSASGQQLASGGNDNLLHIWDSSFSCPTQWLHRLEDHTSAVKALAWCPVRSHILASGGGDRCIKFWNTYAGACLNSVDTSSQVCTLLWNKNNLLSSHGSAQNQLTLWKYPSMVKATFDTPRVLYMAQSPDGCTFASAAGDETLTFWNVSVTPEACADDSCRAVRSVQSYSISLLQKTAAAETFLLSCKVFVSVYVKFCEFESDFQGLFLK